MPTTAPPRAPRLAEPAAQPMSAPAPTPAAVVPTSNAPAPAGSNDEREAGSMRREHTRVCDSRNPHGLAEIAEPCTLAGMHVETLGSGPRLVLVHGSVGNGAVTWSEQRPLAERFTLVVVDRPGYPPNSPLERIDFEEQADEIADLLEPGDHLVGHAFGVARGHTAVEEFLARFPEAPGDPRGYLEFFLPLVGSAIKLPDPLPPDLEAGARAALAERPPHEAQIPLDELAAAPYSKLVTSGAHNAAFDAVCDVLEERLGAKRAVLPGAGHSIPRAPGFNDVLAEFLTRA